MGTNLPEVISAGQSRLLPLAPRYRNLRGLAQGRGCLARQASHLSSQAHINCTQLHARPGSGPTEASSSTRQKLTVPVISKASDFTCATLFQRTPLRGGRSVSILFRLTLAGPSDSLLARPDGGIAGDILQTQGLHLANTQYL